MADELIAWGMPADEAERIAAESSPLPAGDSSEGQGVRDGYFEVWPENENAFNVFLACGTQWRWGALRGCLGLDYAAVESVLRLMKTETAPELFGDLRVMERAALEELNRVRGR